MDYMELDFRCSRKAVKFYHSHPYFNVRWEHDTQLGNAHTEQSFVYHQQVKSLLRVGVIVAPSAHLAIHMSFWHIYQDYTQ